MSHMEIDIEQLERAYRSTAGHETAHAVIAALAGVSVTSISLRQTKASHGVCRYGGLSAKLGPWDLDFFSPRHPDTGKRKADTERLDACTPALLAENEVDMDEWLRVIRAEVCICLAGHTLDGASSFESDHAYPAESDFDYAAAYIQWLRHFGDSSTPDWFSELVIDAIDSAAYMSGIVDVLIEKRYIGQRALAKVLPHPIPDWPPRQP